MSLKSFDKFCEKAIPADSSAAYEKEIFDERQKIILSRLSIEALGICLGICLINALIMDLGYKWSSYCPSMLLIMSVCTVYYLIRCAAKGCLFGISGFRSRKSLLITSSVCGALNAFMRISDVVIDGYIIKDGILTNDFIYFVSFALLTVCGAVTFCGMIVHEKTLYREGSK